MLKLVPNAKQIWRHYSTGMLLGVAALQMFWKESPAEWIAAYPSWFTSNVAYITTAVAVLGIVGKFIKQDLPVAEKPADPAP